MAVDINWGLMNAPNPLMQFAEGLEAGRTRRRQDENDAYVRQRLARQDQRDARQDALAAQEAEQKREALKVSTMTKVFRGLEGLDPDAQHRQWLASAPILKAGGLSDQEIADVTAEDFADKATLNAYLAQLDQAEKEYTLTPGSARYSGGRKIAEQPLAPQYRSVGEGQTLVEVGGGPADGDDWLAAVAEAAPDAQVTSGYRSPDHNARVGGVPGSRHTTGQAVDLVPRPGETMAQLHARVSKIPGVRAINEGDHVHVQVAGGSGGARVVAKGAPKAPKERDAPSGYQFKPDGSLAYIPGGPADPATRQNSLRPIPSAAQKGITANRSTLSKIDAAIAAIQRSPGAMGARNYLGDAINQRIDPKGVTVRAVVADIGSQKIHDRSGAAVTAAEQPRLMPFIPQVTDTPQAAIEKLKNLRAEYEAAVDEAEAFYSPESGYRSLAPAASAAPAKAPQRQASQPVRVRTPAEAMKLPPGTVFITPDGRRKVR